MEEDAGVSLGHLPLRAADVCSPAEGLAFFGSMSSSSEPESWTWYMSLEFLAVGWVSRYSTSYASVSS